MKRHFLFLSLAIMVPFLINGMANSADLAPMKIGQKFIYTMRNSAVPPNLWNVEFKVIEKVKMCSKDYFHLQLWNYDNEGEIQDHYNRSTENNIYVCDKDSNIECSALGNGSVGTTWTCGEDFIEIMEPVEVNVPYGGPYTAVVNRKYNYVEKSPHRFEYVVPGLGWVKQVDYWHDNPPTVLELTRICYDGEKCCFVDFPPRFWAEDAICGIYKARITTGCSTNPLKYCPKRDVNRAQMAVFLERGINGGDYTPPPATGIFDDVSVDFWAADWIEQLYKDGITTGCDKNPLRYCPDRAVNRAQMAVFLLRSKYDSNYTPPKAKGIFKDVPVNYWAADWIEQLYKEGITAGCSTNPLKYCPLKEVNRAQMAVFLSRTFGLELVGVFSNRQGQ